MNVYLISGSSFRLINEKVNDIVKNSKNVVTFDLTNNTMEEIIVEAGYFSLFNEEKYIIVKNADFFGSGKVNEKNTEILLKYLENPNSLSILIFITNEKLDMRKKITKYIKDKYTLITIDNLKSYEIEAKVKDIFKKHNLQIGDESIKYIVTNSLNNYDLVIGEVEKILLYYEDNSVVSFNDLTRIVAKSINTNNFLFVDAVTKGDLSESLSLLNDLKTMKVESTILISLIARSFRYMYNIKVLQNEGVREYEMMRRLNLLDWQLNKYLKDAFIYKIAELESILKKLAKLDLDIKSGKIDKFIGLELFILDISA